VTFLVAASGGVGVLRAHDEPAVKPYHVDAPMNPTAAMRAFLEGKAGDTQGPLALAAQSAAACNGGTAGGYPCMGVDLLTFLPLIDIGGNGTNEEANDIWGWTDPESGREFALIGRTFGTAFVEITTATAPIYLGELVTHGNFGSPWRDIKVYRNHAFIVSEAFSHGMQVFDLGQLLTADPVANGGPITFAETAHYSDFGSAHNIVINEESGFAYAVGSNRCSGGLEMVDIRDPLNPVDAGCFSADGYTHDAQCVIYRGPDVDVDGNPHKGKEICFASNEDTLTIVDVTNKAQPQIIGRSTYDNASYTHQGWLSADHRYFFFDDELDEIDDPDVSFTTTRVWDVSDLEDIDLVDPVAVDFGNDSIDHNLYVKGRFLYQANYRSGLRVLEMTGDPGDPLVQVAYFDVYPNDDLPGFNGAWGNFPYYQSGVVVVSGIEQGLFIVRPEVDHVGISAPHPGAVLQDDGSGIAIVADAVDADGDTIASVEWRLDDEELGGAPFWRDMIYDGGGTYSDTWDSLFEQVPDGLHRLTVRMIDTFGAETSAESLVILDNQGGGGTGNSPPEVLITSPDTNTLVGGRVKLVAAASDEDGTVVGVAFYDLAPSASDPVKIGDAKLAKNGSWSLRWDARNAEPGEHSITAMATDDQGAPGESLPIILAVGGGGDGGGGGGPNCTKNPNHWKCTSS
jgi:choice-of-anchor B domain-containing protein